MTARSRTPYVPPAGSIPTLPVPEASGWRRLHLVGIGGAGMSGIARLLIARGVAVSGSDLKNTRALEDLRRAGATIAVGHRADAVPADADAVVRSSAVPSENPEVRRAVELGLPVLARAQVLAALNRGARGVAVAGTHGKTTTTSMIAVLFSRAGLAPTFVVGGDLNESGSGAEHGSGDIFVAEADESDGTFLLLEPEVGVITNVEPDHLDFYAGQSEIEAAFRAFAGRARAVVACADDPGARAALEGVATAVVWYGSSDEADVVVTGVTPTATGAVATIRAPTGDATVELAVRGRHNVLNAAAAIATAERFGIDAQRAADALRGFSGVRRRFERRGSVRGARFVDDYAHHPTEIAATLQAAAEEAGDRAEAPRGEASGVGRLVAVFQPHRYTRTGAMWRALGESLAAADLVVLTDVYPAGEQPIPGVTGKLVAEAAADARPGRRVVYLPRRLELAPFLARELRDGDLVLTLGAGDVTMVADETLALVRSADGFDDAEGGAR